MESLGATQRSTLLAVTSLIISTVLTIWQSTSALSFLQLGEEKAHYLGVDVRTIQRTLLLCSILLAASAVAVSGVTGFTGLVVLHLICMRLGSDHRAAVPGSVLMDAFLLLIADTLACTATAFVKMSVGLPINLLGAPWFLWLIFRQRGPYG